MFDLLPSNFVLISYLTEIDSDPHTLDFFYVLHFFRKKVSKNCSFY